MNKTWLVSLLGVLLLAGAAWAQGGGTEKAITALEQKWLAAQKAADPGMLAPLLADKFVNTNSEGKVRGKADTLAKLNRPSGIAPTTTWLR